MTAGQGRLLTGWFLWGRLLKALDRDVSPLLDHLVGHDRVSIFLVFEIQWGRSLFLSLSAKINEYSNNFQKATCDKVLIKSLACNVISLQNDLNRAQ